MGLFGNKCQLQRNSKMGEKQFIGIKTPKLNSNLIACHNNHEITSATLMHPFLYVCNKDLEPTMDQDWKKRGLNGSWQIST